MKDVNHFSEQNENKQDQQLNLITFGDGKGKCQRRKAKRHAIREELRQAHFTCNAFGGDRPDWSAVHQKCSGSQSPVFLGYV